MKSTWLLIKKDSTIAKLFTTISMLALIAAFITACSLPGLSSQDSGDSQQSLESTVAAMNLQATSVAQQSTQEAQNIQATMLAQQQSMLATQQAILVTAESTDYRIGRGRSSSYRYRATWRLYSVDDRRTHGF